MPSACWDIKVDFVNKIGNPIITANNTDILQALNNIFVNCVEAFDNSSYKSTYYRHSGLQSGNRISLVIFEDNGIGIKEEHLRKVFDPFFTTKKIGTSIGLGLSLCLRDYKNTTGILLSNLLMTAIPSKSFHLKTILS